MAKEEKKQTKQRAGQRVIVEADIDILVITCDDIYLATLFPNCNVVLPVPNEHPLVAVARKGKQATTYTHISDSSSLWMIK